MNNIHCYFKLLSIYKKVYRERGCWGRSCRYNNLRIYIKRFGDFHFTTLDKF